MKSLLEQMGGTYRQEGAYLIPNITLPEEEQKPIVIWGQRYARYLKQNHKVLYMNLLTSGKLNGYLAAFDEQAEEMFLYLIEHVAKSNGITETLKAECPME